MGLVTFWGVTNYSSALLLEGAERECFGCCWWSKYRVILARMGVVFMFICMCYSTLLVSILRELCVMCCVLIMSVLHVLIHQGILCCCMIGLRFLLHQSE